MKFQLGILIACSLWLSACSDGSGDASGGAGGELSSVDTSCTLRVRYLDSTPVDWLMVGIDYSDVDGSFGEPGRATACRAVPRDVQTALLTNWCPDDCGEGDGRFLQLELFTGQANDGQEIVGPVDVVRCDFRGDPATLEHAIVDRSYSTTNNGTDDNPEIELIADCDGAADTTTTTSTSSTTSTTVCDGSDCDVETLSLELNLDSDLSLQSLQVDVTFPCSAGEFEHLVPEYPWVISDVFRCDRGDLDVELWATAEHTTNADDPALCSRKATFGVITTGSADGPGTLLRCPFRAGDDVDETMFHVDIIVADGVGNPGPDVSGEVAISVNLVGGEE
jgi:hypothetical protein